MKTKTLEMFASFVLIAATLFTVHDPRDDGARVDVPDVSDTYASGSYGGGYFVKSVNGSTWNIKVTDNGDGTGTYKKIDSNGNTTDQGTMTITTGALLFNSEWSDCEGFLLEDEDDPGYFTWVAICDGVPDGGLARKK